ncbi:hypothetical protein EVAR_81634_1 [Eumeta japonica]|uniref:Uncharacterized protein n=1 Tax=Eumeta variegata TaxID=151549 RepID=A0A4C1WDE8_EUMVA|nr:hypothetical protein EVAR_81634_1 [Eumeta japonica]
MFYACCGVSRYGSAQRRGRRRAQGAGRGPAARLCALVGTSLSPRGGRSPPRHPTNFTFFVYFLFDSFNLTVGSRGAGSCRLRWPPASIVAQLHRRIRFGSVVRGASFEK